MTLSSLATPNNNRIFNVAVANDKYKRGGQAHLLWRPVPGSPPPLTVTPLEDALAAGYPTDAHFVTYVVVKGGVHVGYQPRVRKDELPAVRAKGFDVVHDVNVADVDTVGHASLTAEQVDEARERLRKLGSIGWYTTRSGLRIMQPRANPCGPEEYEGGIVSWLAELQEVLGPSWVVDMKCTDWTRMFRLPYVRRDGEHTKPVVEIANMRPTHLPSVVRRVASLRIAPVPTTPTREASAGGSDLTGRRERARAYSARVVPPNCGSSSCDSALWNLALHVVKGFDIDEGAAVDILSQWTTRSEHNWTRKELERKVRDAARANLPSGFHLLDDHVAEPPQMREGEGMSIEDCEPLGGAHRPVDDDRTGDWRSFLMYRTTKAGRVVKNSPGNVEAFLRHHPDWVNRIGFDQFRQALVWLAVPPDAWTALYPDAKSIVRGAAWSEADTTRLLATLNREGIEPTREVVRQFVQSMAASHGYHPVREYLATRSHDGTPRVERWLTTYFGADDNEHNRKAGTWWLIQAVRRVFEPGASAKYVLTIEGPQDLGKSTGLRILCGREWFSDTEVDLGTLNGMLALQGVWIQEIAEGTLLTRASRQALKGWISKPSDHYPPKFSNIAVTVPRQVSFAMTTNEGRYLSDPTGAVRFWPVKAKRVDFAGIERDRDQLWAEAVAMYRAGVIPEPRTPEDRALFAEQVADRQQGDVWDEKVADFLDGKEQVTVDEVLDHLDVKVGQRTRQDQSRVVDCLTALGWYQPSYRPTVGGKRIRIYVPRHHAPTPLALDTEEQRARNALLALGWVESIDRATGQRSWTQPNARHPMNPQHAAEAAALLASL